MPRKSRLDREYSHQIYNFKRFYNTRNQSHDVTNLDQAKGQAWRAAIRQAEKETDKGLMAMLVHVYIIQDRCLSVASDMFLNYSERHARRLVRDWFAKLDRYYYRFFVALLEENHGIRSIL